MKQLLIHKKKVPHNELINNLKGTKSNALMKYWLDHHRLDSNANILLEYLIKINKQEKKNQKTQL